MVLNKLGIGIVGASLVGAVAYLLVSGKGGAVSGVPVTKAVKGKTDIGGVLNGLLGIAGTVGNAAAGFGGLFGKKKTGGGAFATIAAPTPGPITIDTKLHGSYTSIFS